MIPGFILHNLDENMDGNLNEDLDENLAWLTQKTEDPKSNKGNLTSPPHTVNVIELNCKVIESGNPPISTSTPSPFLGLSLLSSKKNCTPPPPPSDSIFGRSYPPSFNYGVVPTMSDNENFCSTTLQPFQFEPETNTVRKKLNIFMLQLLIYYILD